MLMLKTLPTTLSLPPTHIPKQFQFPTHKLSIQTPPNNKNISLRILPYASKDPNPNGKEKEKEKEGEGEMRKESGMKGGLGGGGFKWGQLFLDPDPDNVLAVGLTGLLTWASAQVVWQLLVVSFAIVVAALKYSLVAALLIFILIALL